MAGCGVTFIFFAVVSLIVVGIPFAVVPLPCDVMTLLFDVVPLSADVVVLHFITTSSWVSCNFLLMLNLVLLWSN